MARTHTVVALLSLFVTALPSPASSEEAPATQAATSPEEETPASRAVTGLDEEPPPTAAARAPAAQPATRPATRPAAPGEDEPGIDPSSCNRLGRTCRMPALSVRPPGELPPFFQLALSLELGFLAPVAHSIQYGKGNASFDYVGEGGQDNLFFFWRIQAETVLAQRHSIVFLYQPLNLTSQVTMPRDVTFYTKLFPAGTATDSRYGFDFYRLTYHYDFLGRGRGVELGLGLGLQIRNSTITFTAVDGSVRVDQRNIGPVPLIKLRGRYTFGNGFWLGGEVDGFYAPVKYLNAGASDVEGAIIDLSVRAGMTVWRWANVYLNLRYLGGGAEGTSSNFQGEGDGFVANWLHFLTVSLGFETWASDLW
jgi:hypothetical protein